MNYFRSSLVAFAAAFGVSSSTHAPRAYVAPCVRPPARQLADGATITLTETSRFPCTLRFVNTAIALRSDSAEEIGNDLARGPDGRFYMSMGATGKVSVWNADGSWRRNFGVLGQGPGELARGGKHILFDRAGRLFIGDGNRRWSIFTPAYDFVATIPAGTMGAGELSSAVLLDDGTLLSSLGARDAAFRVYDLQQTATPMPPVLRSFGPGTGGPPRRISYAGGNTFWAAPADGAGLGYVLQRWRTDGTLVRTLRRDVPWVPTGDAARRGSTLPPPEMEAIHDDGNGLVFVTMLVVNKTFLDLTPADRRNRDAGSPADKAIDIYIEVIDGNAVVVLASVGPIHPSEAIKIAPLGYIRGTRFGYRREEDANGFPTMRVIEGQLSAR